MKKAKKKLNWETIGYIVFFTFMVFVIGLSVVYFNLRMETGYTETTNCEVVDKYFHNNARGASRSYYLVLQLESDFGVFEEDIEISKQAFYENIVPGNKVACEVTYDENGIIQLTITEPEAGQVTTAESLKIALIFFSVMFGTIALIFGAIFYSGRKGK